MAQITKETVEHIAELANLTVSGEEEKFAKLLSDTIDYIKVLEELDTSNVQETFQVTGTTNVYQIDNENIATLTREGALSNAKKVVDNLVENEPVFNR